MRENMNPKEEAMKEIKEEVKHMQKTGIPRCMICKKDFINDIDSITGKVSKYLWKPDCRCKGMKDLRVSIG